MTFLQCLINCIQWRPLAQGYNAHPVSYTHLDVYKRQRMYRTQLYIIQYRMYRTQLYSTDCTEHNYTVQNVQNTIIQYRMYRTQLYSTEYTEHNYTVQNVQNTIIHFWLFWVAPMYVIQNTNHGLCMSALKP